MSPTLHIVNHLPNGQSNHYREKFEEAYFTEDGSSQIELVLRRADRSSVGGRDDLVQVVHVRTFWRSIPGITVAESTQINATITYAITRGTQTTVLRGAGSVLIHLNRKGDVLTGTIERAIVKPVEQAGHQAFFDKVELSGKFTAFKDRRSTIRIANELEALTSH